MKIRDKRTCRGRKKARRRPVEWLCNPRSTRWSTSFTVFWYAVCLIGSITPAWKAQLRTHQRHHGSLHLATFFITELITLICGLGALHPAVSTLVVIALAFATEWLQKVVYTIAFEWKDLAVDISGIAAAALIAGATLSIDRYTNPIKRAG